MLLIPISIAVAMTIMFAIVPKPGFSRKGIQSRRTIALMMRVQTPTLKVV
jgi:hypothetical protein